ncbi:MAG: T9SS type A sorting domain-containing protein [Bacteroidota bacterium]
MKTSINTLIIIGILSFLNFSNLEAQAFFQDTYSTSNSDEEVYGIDIIALPDGNLTFVANVSMSIGLSIDPDFNGQKIKGIQLNQTDANGNILWEKTIYTDEGDLHAVSMNLASDGGYLIAGYYDEDTLYPFVMKTDNQGNIQWRKIFGLKGHHIDATASPWYTTFSSGTMSELIENQDGDYVVIGTVGVAAGPTPAMGSFSEVAFVAVLDKYTRSIQNLKTIDDPNNPSPRHREEGLSIRELTFGAYAVLHAGDDYFSVSLLNPSLSVEWTKKVALEGSRLRAQQMVVDGTSSVTVLVQGYYDIYSDNARTEPLLVQLDMDGQLVFSKYYQLDEEGEAALFVRSVENYQEGNFYISGRHTAAQGQVMLKTNPQGEFTTCYHFPVPGSVNNDLAVYESEAFALIGATELNLNKAEIIKANANGDASCNTIYRNIFSGDIGLDITNYELDIDSDEIFNLSITLKSLDVSLNKIRCGVIDIPFPEIDPIFPIQKQSNIESQKKQTLIAPNPSGGIIDIHLSDVFDASKKFNAILFNVNGQKIKEFILSSSSAQLNLTINQKGLYFLQLQQGATVERHRILLH